MEPEVGANPSGRGGSRRASARPKSVEEPRDSPPHPPRAPTAPIIAISAPARSTPRQNSRPRSAVVTRSRSCRLITLLISHLPRRVSPPPRAWRDVLAFHEEGVGGERCAVAHGHAVEDECTDPDRAACANGGSVAFERAVLLRVALDLAAVIEDGVFPDRGERRLGEVCAVVEDPPADPNAHHPPEHVLEGRAIEGVEQVNRMHLTEALGRPEIRVVDGADGRLQRVPRFEAAVQEGEVNRGDHDARREEGGAQRVWQHLVELEGGEVEDREAEDSHPAGEEENADGSKVVPVLCRQAAAQRLPCPEMVESAVTLDGSRNLEARRAQEADPFANLADERDHHLRAEQD